jgi:hypothetical protein
VGYSSLERGKRNAFEHSLLLLTVVGDAAWAQQPVSSLPEKRPPNVAWWFMATPRAA